MSLYPSADTLVYAERFGICDPLDHAQTRLNPRHPTDVEG